MSELDGDIGTRWRVIGTDSESDSGVGPVCPHQDDVTKHSTGDGYLTRVDSGGVYDCCPHPHLECWTEDSARDVAATLNRLGVEVCS